MTAYSFCCRVPAVRRAVSALIGCLLLGGISTSRADQFDSISDNLEFSGFARVIGGYLDADDVRVSGYGDGFSLHQQSLLALQPTYHFTDQLSATVQWLGHTGEDRESGIEWAYLNYDLNDQWQFKAGKLRMPFFHYSDSIDVGYSYSWITAPMQLYNNKLFPTFKGANLSYSQAGEQLALRLEGLYGYYQADEVMVGGSAIDAEARVDDMYGFNLNLSSGRYGLRLAYHTGESKTRLTFLQSLIDSLQQAGFDEAYQSLQASGPVDVFSVGFDYEDFDGFYRVEWVKAVTELDFSPTQTSYYAKAGRFIGDWTLHLTFASASNTRTEPSTELQPLLADTSNPMYPLAAGYYYAYERIPTGGLNSLTLGGRWDFRLNMALKAEATYLKETSPYSGFFVSEDDTAQNNDRTQDGTLYQIGWEWIF